MCWALGNPEAARDALADYPGRDDDPPELRALSPLAAWLEMAKVSLSIYAAAIGLPSYEDPDTGGGCPGPPIAAAPVEPMAGFAREAWVALSHLQWSPTRKPLVSKTQCAGPWGQILYLLVARKGFEPLISALRGRCPGPLDERATQSRRMAGPKGPMRLGPSYQNLFDLVNRPP